MCFMVNIDLLAREITVGAPSTQWWVQLSTAVAFGLTFATMLTLVVTPCLLMLQENFRTWRERRRAQGARAPLDPANAGSERFGEAAE
jgi:multidrug efflux pump